MMTRLLALLLATAALSAQGSQQPSPSGGNTNRAGQAERTRQSDQTPPVQPVGNDGIAPNISIAPTFVQNEGQPQQQANSNGTLADWGMVGLTLVMAAATIYLARVAGGPFKAQTKNTAEALQLARDANEAAAKDRQRATETDKSLVEAANLSTMFQQRSRVGVTHATICDPLGPDTKLVGRIAVRNWGGKPAQPNRYCIAWRTGDLPQIATYPPDNDWVPQDKMLYVRAGKVFLTQPMLGQLSPEQWAEIQSGTLPLYVYGRVDYMSLGNSYHSGFCRRYDHTKKRFVHHYAPQYNKDT